MTWNEESQRFGIWKPSAISRLEVKIGMGTGQRRTPFQVPRAEFFDTCDKYGFCTAFLRKVPDRASFFEHHFGYGTDSSTGISKPSHLEIAASNYENAAFLLLLRAELGSSEPRAVKCILFFHGGFQYNATVSSLIASLNEHVELLDRNPLLIVNTILTLLQEYTQEHVHWRRMLNGIEARLGVTRSLVLLIKGGYPKVDYDFNALNADLAGLAKEIAENELAVSTILEHAKALQRLAKICERYEALRTPSLAKSLGPADEGQIPSEQLEEIQGTITRGEIYARHVKMTQDVLQSLTAVLYNRINKNDTQSMKTIAVATLFFLPATFVSAIFSTGVFNFQAGEAAADQRVISRYGWVYLVVCLVLTVVTLVAWICWYLWGGAWIDKFRRPQGKIVVSESA
jgi:hypothetical protein